MIPKKGSGTGASKRSGGAGAKIPSLDDFLQSQDFTGAITLLEFNRRTGDNDAKTLLWLAYCAFHLGDYRKAVFVYEEASVLPGCPKEVALYRAACHYYLQQYSEAESLVMEAPDCPLRTRLLFHTCHKLGKQDELLKHHSRLSESKLDQLSLAAMHALRIHYNEAIDIYKRLLLEHRDDVALNVFIAMCYYRLDYYDVAQEILQVYLASRPTSLLASNLKACNIFRMYNGRAAEAEFKQLADTGVNIEESDLMRHNLCVFRGGEGALKVLPPLVDVLPEARLNLVIYHLRQGTVQEAYDLMRGIDPQLPAEYILKGIVHTMLGQKPAAPQNSTGIATTSSQSGVISNPREHLRMAQEYFNMIGASASECDTIPGRQSMASCYFLLKQFEDANVYFNSIKPYLTNDDDFNWNFSLSLAATGDYKGAEECLLLVQTPSMTSDVVYLSWLVRCYCMNKKARQAWEVYLRMDSGPEAQQILQIIASDAYKTGQFLIAAKALDVLQRLDPDPEYWDGLKGAAAGVLQAVIAGQETKESLRDILSVLRSIPNQQAEFVSRTILRWIQASDQAGGF